MRTGQLGKRRTSTSKSPAAFDVPGAFEFPRDSVPSTCSSTSDRRKEIGIGVFDEDAPLGKQLEFNANGLVLTSSRAIHVGDVDGSTENARGIPAQPPL